MKNAIAKNSRQPKYQKDAKASVIPPLVEPSALSYPYARSALSPMWSKPHKDMRLSFATLPKIWAGKYAKTKAFH
jgi:hypothetical protein